MPSPFLVVHSRETLFSFPSKMQFAPLIFTLRLKLNRLVCSRYIHGELELAPFYLVKAVVQRQRVVSQQLLLLQAEQPFAEGQARPRHG